MRTSLPCAKRDATATACGHSLNNGPKLPLEGGATVSASQREVRFRGRLHSSSAPAEDLAGELAQDHSLKQADSVDDDVKSLA